MAKIKTSLIFLIFAILSACKSNLSVTGGQVIRPKVETLDRAAAKPGEQISFSGTNLTEDMDVLIDGQVIPIKILGKNLGSFTLPASLPSGVLNVSFRQNGFVLHTMPLINAGTIANLPLTTADPSQICDDSLFAKPDGTILRGTRICKPNLCTRDGQNDCLANPDFPAVSAANALAPGNIRAGVTIGGIAGTLVPCGLCTADGQTNCITGPRFKAMDTDPSVISNWDIRRGKQAGGITGKIEFRVNMIDLSLYDRLPTGPDVYDTIDDFAGYHPVPTTNVPGFPSYDGPSFVRDPASDNGVGVSDNGICDGGEDCVYLDRLTGLRFSPLSVGSVNFDDSISACSAMNYGGYDDWRLPMQKEAYQAYINGFSSVSTALGNDRTVQIYAWTGTTISGAHSQAYIFANFAGFVAQVSKTALYQYHCVR